MNPHHFIYYLLVISLVLTAVFVITADYFERPLNKQELDALSDNEIDFMKDYIKKNNKHFSRIALKNYRNLVKEQNSKGSLHEKELIASQSEYCEKRSINT